jgi:methionyl-tRNA formyltransferase
MSSGAAATQARRIVYAANQLNGLNVLHELRRQEIEIEFLIVHSLDNSHCRQELVQAAGTPSKRIIIWNRRSVPEIAARLREKQSENLFSVNFGYRFPTNILELFTRPINLHLSLLPFNKGAYPNVWSIIEGTPAGVSLHIMTAEFDDGPILVQREVEVAPDDTAETLYRNLLASAVELVRKYLPDILDGRVAPREQPPGGTFHTERDFRNLLRLEPERRYVARDLINLMRALTFPPHANLYFEHEAGRSYLNLQLCRDRRPAPAD